VNDRGLSLDESRVRKQFARILKSAGLSGHRVYDLRHTFATLLLACAPITYVAAQLGHARPSTTLQWYAHWLPSDSKSFVDSLDRRETTWRQSGTNFSSAPEPQTSAEENRSDLKAFFGGPSETRTPDPLIKSCHEVQTEPDKEVHSPQKTGTIAA